ncbi:MAG: hypothetical protein M5U28_16735 [Sandaracinaceae bacterium]|nr:hypothetical protein [Sandaracinaceae bacterium]
MSTILTAGIDVGTAAVKASIVESPSGSGRERPGARVIASHVERIRRRDQKQVIRAAYDEVLKLADVREPDLRYVATTGEGELVDFRTGHFYGMTAHARGAIFLDPEARAAVDVGALHARAIVLDERARVLGYQMTSQCASGSGQFLENVARYLGVTLDEIGPLSLSGGEARGGLGHLRGACGDRRHQHGLARHLPAEHPAGDPRVHGGSPREAPAQAQAHARRGPLHGRARSRRGPHGRDRASARGAEAAGRRGADAPGQRLRGSDRRRAVGRLPLRAPRVARRRGARVAR